MLNTKTVAHVVHTGSVGSSASGALRLTNADTRVRGGERGGRAHGGGVERCLGDASRPPLPAAALPVPAGRWGTRRPAEPPGRPLPPRQPQCFQRFLHADVKRAGVAPRSRGGSGMRGKAVPAAPRSPGRTLRRPAYTVCRHRLFAFPRRGHPALWSCPAPPSPPAAAWSGPARPSIRAGWAAPRRSVDGSGGLRGWCCWDAARLPPAPLHSTSPRSYGLAADGDQP